VKQANDNSLNIGRDDITPAAFVHVPRPPTCSPGVNFWQRRFGGYSALRQQIGFIGPSTRVTVFRAAMDNIAELTVQHKFADFGENEMTLRLSADEMQTLACALLDAAHDLRTLPGVDCEIDGEAA
jgi:hypothetical protein